MGIPGIPGKLRDLADRIERGEIRLLETQDTREVAESNFSDPHDFADLYMTGVRTFGVRYFDLSGSPGRHTPNNLEAQSGYR